MSLSSISSQRSWPFSPCSAKAGRTPSIGEEAGVAPPALAALGDQEAVAVARQVALHRAVVVAHDGPDRHRHHDVLAPGAVLLLPRPVTAVGGPPEGVVPEAQERRLVDRGHQPDVAPVATVPTVGTTAIDMGLTPPRHGPGPPVAGTRVQLSLIDETCHIGPA